MSLQCDNLSGELRTNGPLVCFIHLCDGIASLGRCPADQTEKVGAFRAERTVKVVPLQLIKLGKKGAFRKSGCF